MGAGRGAVLQFTAGLWEGLEGSLRPQLSLNKTTSWLEEGNLAFCHWQVLLESQERAAQSRHQSHLCRRP